jgi:WD40 repeat protein/Tfp pilus assembly protein PilF
LLFDLDIRLKAIELRTVGNAISPTWLEDSRTLVVGGWSRNNVHVFDALLARRLLTLQDQKGGEPILGMSTTGQLLTSISVWAPSGHVFWHPFTGKLLLRTPFRYVPVHRGSVQDGRLYDVTVNKTRLTLRTAEPSPVFRTLVPDAAGLAQRECRDVTIHPNGTLLAVGHSNGVSLFDLPTGREVGRLDLGRNMNARFDPSSGDLLTCGQRGLLRWPVRLTPGQPQTITVGPPSPLRRGAVTSGNFDVSQDGKVVAFAAGTGAGIYWQQGKETLYSLLGGLTNNRFVHLSPDGQWALTVMHESRKGIIWDMRKPREPRRIKEVPVGARGGSPHHNYYGTFFTPDRRWLTNGRQRWKVGTWENGPPMVVEGGASILAFSPDGTLFAGQADNESVHLVHTASGKTLVQLGLPEQSRCYFATFSPDGGQLVLTSTDHQYIYVWDLRTLRRHLGELGLDWNATELPPAPEAPGGLPPVVTVKPIDPNVRLPNYGARFEPATLRSNGIARVRARQWTKADAAFDRALLYLPDEHSLWIHAAVVRAQVGNKEAYRQHCAKMLESFGSTTNPAIAERTVKVCCLMSGVSVDPQKLSTLARLAVTQPPKHPRMPWFYFAYGLLEYRQGRWDQAAEWLEKGLVKPANDYGAATGRFVLAMTQQQRGQADAARATLAQGQEITSRQLPPLVKSGDQWVAWVINDMLRGEAEGLILGPARKGEK